MLRLILTCEHGGNQIPPSYKPLFRDHEEVLQTHRGYDIGALELFNAMKPVADVSYYAETSRLLVELNRSLHHDKLFSEFSQVLGPMEKERLLAKHYTPYRQQLEEMIADFVSAGRRILHVAVHTFTPVLDGEERKADIGLLYDPKRPYEQAYSREWKKALNQADNELLVRFNYPYLGISDGLPTYLRRKFGPKDYVGIELEVNQKYPQEGGQRWQQLQALLASTLEEVLLHNRAKLNEEA